MPLKWYDGGIVTTIDSASRVVIPKAMRQRLGQHGGHEVEIDLVAGHIQIHPRGVDVAIDRLDDGPVLRAPAEVPALAVADVPRLIDEIRIR